MPGTRVDADAHKRQRDAQRTRSEILDVAAREFSNHGYAGARVDEIAAQMQTTKRMIYYYFGGKEQLYVEVLKRAYAGIRAAEAELDVDGLDPVSAIRRLAELTFDHHEANPDFIRLVSIENIHRGEHMAKAGIFADLNSPIRELIARILERGQAEGLFRRRVDALDVHMMISSFCVFRVANRYTFGAIFGRDLADSGRREHYRAMLSDMVVDYLSAAPVR
ncbi:MAG TPA: TetR family transcriptional regulator [Solirubrobacteraceae bacterium]|nr:TetR family transcriptional regulator [Solirubrobacteraceae bacterium]